MCLLRRDTLEKVFLHFEQSCDFGLISFLGTSDLNVAISYKTVLLWNTDIFIRSYIWLIVGAVVLLIFLLVVLLLLNLQILGGRDLLLLISTGPGGLGLQQPDTLAQAHQAGVRPVHNVTLSIGVLGIVVSTRNCVTIREMVSSYP